MAFRDASLEALFRLLRQTSGLILTADKAYLVESRLKPVSALLGFTDVERFVDYLALAPSAHAVQLTVEAMATHETSFFRDQVPFDRLRTDLLPALLKQKTATAPIRILCAACSSGQEPLSLAMMLDEMGLLPRVQITAFDISEPILEKARSGTYSAFQVNRGLTPERIARHFTKTGDNYVAQPRLMQTIFYRSLNILSSLTGIGNFDIVFCRNVLIYFDDATKTQILKTLSHCTEPNGVLILGSSETLLRENRAFVPEKNGRGIFIHQPAAVLHSARAASA